MIIADLNYLETISEDTQIAGGIRRGGIYFPLPKSVAYADATAQALGSFYNKTYTFTQANAVAGVFASSASSSSAVAVG